MIPTMIPIIPPKAKKKLPPKTTAQKRATLDTAIADAKWEKRLTAAQSGKTWQQKKKDVKTKRFISQGLSGNQFYSQITPKRASDIAEIRGLDMPPTEAAEYMPPEARGEWQGVEAATKLARGALTESQVAENTRIGDLREHQQQQGIDRDAAEVERLKAEQTQAYTVGNIEKVAELDIIAKNKQAEINRKAAEIEATREDERAALTAGATLYPTMTPPQQKEYLETLGLMPPSVSEEGDIYADRAVLDKAGITTESQAAMADDISSLAFEFHWSNANDSKAGQIIATITRMLEIAPTEAKLYTNSLGSSLESFLHTVATRGNSEIVRGNANKLLEQLSSRKTTSVNSLTTNPFLPIPVVPPLAIPGASG